jgi:hypothetical protein
MDVNTRLSVVFDEKNQTEGFKNGIARDLNRLIGQAQYELETEAEHANELALATLRIVERVREFEGIKDHAPCKEENA